MKKIVSYLAYSMLLIISEVKAADNRCIVPCSPSGPAATFCNLNISQNLCVAGDTQLNGNLTVCGSFTGPTVTTANYVYAYDINDQSVNSPNTFQDISFDVNQAINGWLHIAGQAEFTAQQSGLYLVQYHAILNQTNDIDTISSIRAVLAGTEVPGSAITLDIPASGESVEISNSFLMSITSVGQVLTFQLTGSTTDVELFADPNGESDVIPSITVTIVKIA